jgi:hypothetical protein
MPTARLLRRSEAGDARVISPALGISIDGDGHICVFDAQNRVQVFTPEGRLLIYMGEPGLLPGQFQSLVNVMIDKNNRVLTTELYPGRLQVFRYHTNSEAKAELDRRNAEGKKNADQKKPASSSAPDPELTRSGGRKACEICGLAWQQRVWLSFKF